MTESSARVVAVCRSTGHTFAKAPVGEILLVEGVGVDGDAHAGRNVQHLSRIRRDPSAPNLRQVHLLHRELLDLLVDEGYAVAPGALGENVTTVALPLLDLPAGTRLGIGAQAVVRVTGLRNPCRQLDQVAPGLMGRLTPCDPDGAVVRLAGIMGVVERGGVVRPGDDIAIALPRGLRRPLRPV